jgi:hypothetical protein
MSTLKVALLQLFSFSYDQEANQAKGAQFCCQARQGGADIALFPEMWNIGYQLPDPSQPAQVELWQRHAIDRQSAFVSSFRKLACDLDMAIGLTYLEKWDGAPRNSLSLIDRHGDICLTYAKMHTCGWVLSLTPVLIRDNLSPARLNVGFLVVGCAKILCRRKKDVRRTVRRYCKMVQCHQGLWFYRP